MIGQIEPLVRRVVKKSMRVNAIPLMPDDDSFSKSESIRRCIL